MARKKLNSLFVVSKLLDKTEELKLFKPEELSSEQLEIAKRYVKLSGAKGSFMGVLLGSEAADIRPLMLEDGKLTVLSAEEIKSEDDSEGEKVEANGEKAAKKSSLSANRFAIGAFFVGAFLIIYFIRSDSWHAITRRFSERPPYQSYWESAQPALMRQVAEGALLDGDEEARSLITNSIFKGSNSDLAEFDNYVNSDLVRVAFNPKWEGDLTENDREVALFYALRNLMGSSYDLPDIDDVHPAVVLAITGTWPLDAEGLPSLPIMSLVNLPSPYGAAFAGLSQLGINEIDNPVARGLAHILVGDINQRSLVAYFLSKGDNSVVDVLLKIRVLLPLLSASPALENIVYQFLWSRSDVVGGALHWFDDGDLAAWATLPKTIRLGIAAGKLPELISAQGLSFEQTIDLLNFPFETVRKEVLDKLLHGGLQSDLVATVKYLTGNETHLTRTQAISLMLALRLKGDSGDAFVSSWFQTAPDPQAVLGVLLARSDAPKSDGFNLQAARFLISKDLKIELEDLKKLVNHPESLARALAYAKLNPSLPEHAALLKELGQNETSPRLRNEINKKLGEH